MEAAQRKFREGSFYCTYRNEGVYLFQYAGNFGEFSIYVLTCNNNARQVKNWSVDGILT